MAQNTAWLTGAWYRAGAALARHRLTWRRPAYRHEARRWLVLQSGPNASTDYYIRPRAADHGMEMSVRDVNADTPASEDFPEGTQVVVVRYLSKQWAEALRVHTGRLASVVYFMDDDLLDPAAWDGLPRPYHDKLARHYATVSGDIAALASQLWVSTSELASRYRELDPAVTPPLPLVDDVPRRTEHSPFVRVFYHGTQSHEAEIRWLRPVVAACLDACPHVHFEIIGNHMVNQLYRALPRTRVLHPMSWPNYVSHCRSMAGHIGLVPLLPSGFNAGRSHTKMMDVARCGGFGIYTKAPPYEAVVRHGVDGLLLPSREQAWIEHLVGLANDGSALALRQQQAGKHLLQRPRHLPTAPATE